MTNGPRTSTEPPRTLRDAILYFADADRALEFVVKLRWPDGVTCPRCGADSPSFLTTRRIWKCKACRQQFSVKVGTIFEDSPLGLDKWLPALWLLANAKNGVSSYELARSLKVTQKTAWFMLSRIRLAMQTKSFRKYDGDVEVDETYIGGASRFMHRSKRARLRGTGAVDKVAIIGVLQRKKGKKHSSVRTAVVPGVKARHLEPHVHLNVEPGSNVYTDKANAYTHLHRTFEHGVVDHNVRYVEGKKHTNGLENFWSLLKRSIKGTYISVDPIHLSRYATEQAFRFNSRKASDFARFRMVVKNIFGKRLTYSELTSQTMLPATT